MTHTMKALALSILSVAIALVAAPAHTQPVSDIREGNADYPVPVPAALSAAASDISPLFLEPSTVRTVALSSRRLWNNNEPQYAVGAEFAPLLMGNGIDLSEYLSSRLLRVLLRTRLSFGVEYYDRGSICPALGLRWMLHDDADLRADSSFQRAIEESRREKREPNFDSIRATMKEALWNRSVVEMAFAVVYHSLRDGASNSTFEVARYHGFLSAGFPMLGRDGQLQFGAAGWVGRRIRGTPYQRQGSLTLRSYYGSASERAFIGARMTAASLRIPDFRAELGGSIRIGNGFWVRPDLSVSLLKSAPQGPEAGLTLSFGTPES